MIALHGGNTHLAHDAQDAIDGSGHIIFQRGLRFFAVEFIFLCQIFHGFQCQIGIDGSDAETDERREVVDFSRFPGFQDDTYVRADLGGDEVIVEAGRRQERRDGHVFLVHAAVRKDDDVRPFGYGFAGFHEKISQCLLHGAAAAGYGVEKREHHGLELFRLQIFDEFHFLIGEERAVDRERRRAFLIGVHDVCHISDAHRRRGDDLLTDAVNRRIRDLGEVLLEIIVKQLRLLREDGERRIHTHGADGFLPILCHRCQDVAEVFHSVAEIFLLLQQVLRHFRLFVAFHQILQIQEMLFAPLAVGVGLCHGVLDFIVSDDALLRGVHQENFARFQAALAEHVLLAYRHGAHFGGKDHAVVLHDVVTRRAQAISIQHATDAHAVAETHGRRTVPRFHHEIVIAIESLLLFVHGRVFFPRFRDHHHHSVGQRVAGHVDVLQAVIKHSGVRAGVVHHREDLRQLRMVRWPGLALAGIQPIDISSNRIDFPIVNDVAVRMGAGPAGEGIRGETGVHHGHGGLEIQVRQVQVEMAELVRREHALVHDGAGRQAGDVEIGAHTFGERNDFLFRQAANDVKLSLEIHLVFDGRVLADEDLQETRADRAGGLADDALINRHLAPTKNGLAFALYDFFKDPHLLLAEIFVAVCKDHAHAVLPFRWQVEAQDLALPVEKFVRNLRQDAGTVAALLIRPLAASVLQVFQNLHGVVYDAVRTHAPDIRYKADAAGIMFIPRVIETLLLRIISPFLHCHPSCV